MIDKIISINPNNTVHQALEIFEINNIRSLPVIDESGRLVGLFGLRHILLNLLPKSATMQDGLPRLDFVMGAAPGIAKRLKKIYNEPVSEYMDKNPTVLYPGTSTWEALRVMALHGSPISIVEEKTGNFVGMISRQSLIADMHALMEKMEEEGEI
jgi:CBS domain-containing protein